MSDDNFIGRLKYEIQNWTRRTWTFEDVGAHWDSTEDYDDINEKTYSYFRRFVDGLRMSDIKPDSHVLDICARTGKGTVYFSEHGLVKSAVCVDVSHKFGEICKDRLREAGITDFDWVAIDDYKLPFEDATFDAVLNFETVEHVPEPERLVDELGRVTKPDGVLILTTPNALWEPLAAVAWLLGMHHSEGPHRFIGYGRLKRMVREAGFEITNVETTVLVPGGPDWLVRFGEWVEQRTRKTLMPIAGLRHVIVGRKR